MLDAMISFAAVLVPFVAVLLLLELAARLERSRTAAVARQIELTDAIHARLGAVVAPAVRRRAWGRWQVDIPMPLGRPETSAAVLAVAHETFRTQGTNDVSRVRIVLTPQEGVAR